MIEKFSKRLARQAAFLMQYTHRLLCISFVSYILAFICFLAYGCVSAPLLGKLCTFFMIFFIIVGACLSGVINLFSMFHLKDFDFKEADGGSHLEKEDGICYHNDDE